MEDQAGQKSVEASGEEIKPPESIRVSSQPRTIRIEWRKSLGMVKRIDGYIVLLGLAADKLQEFQRLPFKQGELVMVARLKDLNNGQTYYVSVVSFCADKQSVLPGIWKITPQALRISLGVKLSSDLSQSEIVSDEIIKPAAVLSSATDINPTNVQQKIDPTLAKPSAVSTPKIEVTLPPGVVALCGCGGHIRLNTVERVYQCQQCQKSYVQRLDGKYILINILPNGICYCCLPKRPLLAQGDIFLRCIGSNQQYCRLNGRTIKVSELDYGLCGCCKPPQPLILNQQGQVVCSSKKEQLYIKEGAYWVMRKPDIQPNTVDELDRALRDGMAVIGPGGVMLTSENGSTARSRRRRNNDD